MGKRLIILPSPVGLLSTNPFTHVFASLYGTYYCRRIRRMYRRSLAIVIRLSHLMYDPKHKLFCPILFRNVISPSIFHLLLSYLTRMWRRSFGTIRCRRICRMYRRSSAIVLRLSQLIYYPRLKSFCPLLFRNAFSPSIFHFLFSYLTRMWQRSFGTIRCEYL